jgi:signal transduction histidine kinase
VKPSQQALGAAPGSSAHHLPLPGPSGPVLPSFSGSSPIIQSMRPDLSSEPPEVTIRFVGCAAMYVHDRLGADVLDRVCAQAGVSASDVREQKRWISVRQVSIFYDAVRELVADEAAMQEALAYKLKEAYGSLKYVFWAASPMAIIKLAALTLKPLASSVCAWQMLEQSGNGIRLRYVSERKEWETRLTCLGRRVHTAAFPTFWGLPPASVKEEKCIAWGDDVCECEFRWQLRPRWLPSVLGAALGIVSAGALADVGVARLPAWISFALLGGCLAHILELRRTNRMNLAFGAEIQEAATRLADEAAEAKHEIFELHQRQEEWTRLLEEQVAERTEMAHAVVERIQKLREARETNLRGFSHDLRNPMTVLRTNIDFLRELVANTPENIELLDDLTHAISKMDTLLTELLHTATAESRLVRLVPTVVDIQGLAEQLRKRVRALVHGRDIRASVFCTNRAPDKLETDPMLLDRVMDNLLTNAAKYTSQGSILVELDGTPGGTLTIRVADTGRGIPPDQLPRVFRPGGTGAAPTVHSFGVGLSVVVQLLAQVGGSLEVLSQPGKGTTFWAHFPARLRVSLVARAVHSDVDSLIRKVVTIRKGDAA